MKTVPKLWVFLAVSTALWKLLETPTPPPYQLRVGGGGGGGGGGRNRASRLWDGGHACECLLYNNKKLI